MSLQPKREKIYFYMAKYGDEVLVDARKQLEENLEPFVRIIPLQSVIVWKSEAEEFEGQLIWAP